MNTPKSIPPFRHEFPCGCWLQFLGTDNPPKYMFQSACACDEDGCENADTLDSIDCRKRYTRQEMEALISSSKLSGKQVDPGHHTFTTGAKRGTGKPRYDLIPKEALQAWAEAFAEGAEKYGLHNWLQGFPSSNLMNHAIDHIYSYLRGDRSEDHLGHALWNIGAAVYNDRARPNLVDCPPYPDLKEHGT